MHPKDSEIVVTVRTLFERGERIEITRDRRLVACVSATPEGAALAGGLLEDHLRDVLREREADRKGHARRHRALLSSGGHVDPEAASEPLPCSCCGRPSLPGCAHCVDCTALPLSELPEGTP